MPPDVKGKVISIIAPPRKAGSIFFEKIVFLLQPINISTSPGPAGLKNYELFW